MKILHVYKDFDPPIRGGIERHVALMCRYQRQWAEVEALMCSRTWRTRRITREGTQLTEVGEWGRFQSAPISPMFPVYLKMRRADVVVIHVPNPTAELSWLMTRPSGKLAVRYHSDVVRQASAMKIYGPFLKHFLTRADVVIPTSEPYARTSPMLGQIDPAKIRVVPLGIIAEEFQRPDMARVAQLRAEYGGESGRYVLFSGIHRYYKGLDCLIQAADRIDAPVVVAGDGPEHERIRRLARDLRISVHFPGPLSHDDLVDHFHGCEVFLFPSVERSEAFGISMLEAQVCGKPVVATQLGTGVEYVNLDGLTGHNVPPRDPVAFANAVNRLLADDAARTQMGSYARERVMREFTAESTARQEFMLYQEILG